MADFYAARSGIIPPLQWPTFSPPFSLGRVSTDDSLSLTLGHREPGDSVLADLETLLEGHAANQGAQGARTGAQAVRTDAAAAG